MGGQQYSKVLTVILIIIIVAIVGLLGYLGYDYISKTIKTNSANDFVDTFEKQQTALDEKPIDEGTVPTTTVTPTPEENPGVIPTIEDITDTNTSQGSTTKKKATYKGFETVGTIEIPKTNVKYPVLAKLSAKALDTAVCVVYPQNAQLNTVGNVVIAGHNYRDGRFFANNKKLSVGDKIYITDLYGKKITYVIYNKAQVGENDTSSYKKNTNGKREITLSTCTDNAKQRIILEAREQ